MNSNVIEILFFAGWTPLNSRFNQRRSRIFLGVSFAVAQLSRIF